MALPSMLWRLMALRSGTVEDTALPSPDSVLVRAHEDMPERIAKQNCHRTCFQRSSKG